MNQLVYITSTKPSWYSLAAALTCSLSKMWSPPLGSAKTGPGVVKFFNHQPSTTIHPPLSILHPPSTVCTSSIGRMLAMLDTYICAFQPRAQAVMEAVMEEAKKWVVPRSHPSFWNLTLLTIIQLQSVHPPTLPSFYYTRHIQLTIHGIFTKSCRPSSSA